MFEAEEWHTRNEDSAASENYWRGIF